MMFVLFGLDSFIINRARRDRVREKSFFLLLVLITTVHPNVADTAFQVFFCQAVRCHLSLLLVLIAIFLQVFGHVHPWLEADFTMQCFQGVWWLLAIYSIIVIGLYIMGLPLVMVFVLRKRKQKVSIRQTTCCHLICFPPFQLMKLHQEMAKNYVECTARQANLYFKALLQWEHLSFLHIDYNHVYYFESIEITRKLIFTAGVQTLEQYFPRVGLGLAIFLSIFSMNIQVGCFHCL